MKWILIIILASTYAGGISTAEFNDEVSCHKAMALIDSLYDRQINTYCLPKGEEIN